MNRTLDERLLYSFKEHITYRLAEDLGAWGSKTLNLYEYTPDKLPGKIAYGSAYHNWLYDTSITTIPTTVGGMVRGGAEGLRFDFNNGRILVNSGNTGLNLSLTVPVAEFGVKITSSPDAKLINEVNVLQIPDQVAISTYAKPDTIICPVIFVKLVKTTNKPFALSGLDWTSWHVRTIVFAQHYKHLVGIGGMVRDLRERMIPILTEAQVPQGPYNDLKVPPWTYESYFTNTDRAIVMESVFDVIEIDDPLASRNPGLQVGIAESQIMLARTPRS